MVCVERTCASPPKHEWNTNMPSFPNTVGGVGAAGSGMIAQVDDRLAYFLCSVDQAKKILPCQFRNSLILPGTLELNSVAAAESAHELCICFNPLGLDSLYRFSFIISCALRRSHDQRVIICGGNNPRSTTNAALLFGAYLILCRNFCVEEVEGLFQTMEESFVPYDDGVVLSDCWRALAHARFVWFITIPKISINSQYL